MGYTRKSSYPGITPEIAASGVDEALKVLEGDLWLRRYQSVSAGNVVAEFVIATGLSNALSVARDIKLIKIIGRIVATLDSHTQLLGQTAGCLDQLAEDRPQQ